MEDFITIANDVHNNKYSYDNTIYSNCKNAIKISCPIHGEFEQTPDNHLSGKGCPLCKTSKGELRILKYLTDQNILSTQQHTFDDCKNARRLPFDFYLPSFNILIEFDGKQHYTPIKLFGGIEGFKKRQYHDDLKTKFANDNGIKLIRIPYDKFNEIELILNENIGVI